MIIIDPAKGGSDEGFKGNGIVEKNYNLLISKYIYDRLKELGANVTLLRDNDETITENERAEIIKKTYGNNSNVIAVSNILNVGNQEGSEIVYALRNSDTLAKKIATELENVGRQVNKYYQRRSEFDTSKDYYDLQKNTGNVETIILNYGYVDNTQDANNLKNNIEKYGEAVVKALANYKNINYVPKINENTYTVQKGDSLYSIAKKYNTTVDNLKEINNLNSNVLSIGQVLKISTVKEDNTYTVQKGDSLYSIAKKYNTTVDNLKEINNLNSNVLSIGQVLKISTAKEDNTYTVQKGDSLYSIAKKYNITVDNLKEINNLNSNVLSIGQVLKIPTVNNTYTVQKGDSLYSIAKKYNTTVENLKEINNLNSNILSIGQQLIV